MTLKHLFPPAWPSLNLDFANTRALDPRIRFARSTTGSYVDATRTVRFAAVDEPRFDYDPETGESLGLLIEEARTNTVEYSEDLNNGYWSKQNCSLGATTTAPDGTNSAYLVIPDNVNTNNHSVRIGVSGLSQQRSQSCFAKAGGYNYVVFKGQNVDCVFDLSTGTANNGGKMIAYPNGWYRCILNTSAFMGSNVGWGCSPFAYGGGAGNETDGVYLWGLQWENSVNFATSYIATSGAPLDRAADICSIGGSRFSSWYNQDEGAYLVEVTGFAPPNNQYYCTAFRGSSGNKGMSVRTLIDGTANLNILNGSNIGLNNSTLDGCKVTEGAKIVFTYGNGFFNARGSNSNKLTTLQPSSSWRVPIPDMGSLQFSYQDYTHHIKRAAYYPRQLSDEQLQALTA